MTLCTKGWKKKQPTFLENQCIAHGGKFPSTLVPCLKSTALTLTFQSPLTPSHPLGPYYITTTTSTISVFLLQNSYILLAMQVPAAAMSYNPGNSMFY